MSQPSVCCICLTADRQAFTDRAVRCFLSQTYKNSTLLIYDTGKKPYNMERLSSGRIVHVVDGHEMSGPIGALRNRANSLTKADILAHWDSDDWSGPYRIQDQVQSLIDGGRQCVGYRNVLFWRAPVVTSSAAVMTARALQAGAESELLRKGEAWAYSNPQDAYCIGSSLCYWRRIWEQQKFREDYPRPDGGMGEDREWLRKVDSQGYPAISGESMVCEIHGGNTTPYDIEAQKERGDTFWKRAPEWDARLAEVMQL